eukprot:scaffold6971_cov177-Ochromonas_danica.AAC.1
MSQMGALPSATIALWSALAFFLLIITLMAVYRCLFPDSPPFCSCCFHKSPQPAGNNDYEDEAGAVSGIKFESLESSHGGVVVQLSNTLPWRWWHDRGEQQGHLLQQEAKTSEDLP